MINKILIFAAGVAIGSAVTWKLIKDKYKKLADEEIASVKEVWNKKHPTIEDVAEACVKEGMDVDIVKIEGSVELAPLLGLADGIVDIVETGVTLRENGLEVVEDVVPISARLIANTVSLKLRQTEIEALIQKIEEALSK